MGAAATKRDGFERVGLQPTLSGGTRASCLPDSWRWSVCSACFVQPAAYSDASYYQPPRGFPGWQAIESTFKPPAIYDPPQLNAQNEFSSAPLTRYQLNWLTHRSPLCNPPGLPCCSCLKCCNCCCPGMYYFDMTEPDQKFLKMLSVQPTPHCPAQLLGGVYWMHGNYAPEVVLTFQDANWVSPSLALKLGAYNWSHDETCFGCIMANGTALSSAPLALRIEVSPNRKWIMLNTTAAQQEATGGNTIWMYRPDPGETFFRPDGSELDWEPGDFIRLTFQNPFDSTSPLHYQYIARRVAFQDANGLVKTRAYAKFLEEASMPLPHPNTCCGSGNCNLTPQQFLDNFAAQNQRQQIIYAPTPPGAAPPMVEMRAGGG